MQPPYMGGSSVVPNRTLIFLHIPKAAGSTLHSILEREYDPEETYTTEGPGLVREARFAELPLAVRARYRLIKGHMYFGIHRHVPNPSRYVTVIRHPVERVVSHYWYVRRWQGHRLHERVCTADMTLEEYVSSRVTRELNNGQVRNLVGPGHLSVEYGQCDESMLSQAFENLEKWFAVVGIAERFDETLLVMRRELAWKKWPFYVAKNVSRRSTRIDELPGRVVRRIERDNELDLELYERARAGFDASVRRFGIDGQLAVFQLGNRFYARANTSVRKIRRSFGHTKRRSLPVQRIDE